MSGMPTGSNGIHFDCADLGEPALGYIVENRLLQHALWVQLESAGNVTAIYPAATGSGQLGCGWGDAHA